MPERSMRISVIGLGKLGACMAAAMAERGHQVVGVDAQAGPVLAINEGRAPVSEPELQELVEKNSGRLRATTDTASAILDTDITFVVVPTPSEPSGSFSLAYALPAFRAIGQALARKTRYHLVVLTSTVLPGSTRHALIPELERASGRRCGPDFGVCYSPEFIALGSVVRDFLNPDFTLIGEVDERAGSILEQAYVNVLENEAPARRMSLENAELAKIALNTLVTTKITFANLLAELCEGIPGGDVDIVSGALGLDRRIGRRYLTGAVSYGGPCFPRDNLALSYFARALDARAALAETTHAANEAGSVRIAARLQSMAKGRPIGIAGLAYKPDTPVCDAAAGIAIATLLAAQGEDVHAFDPLANESARRVLPPSVHIASSLESLLAATDVILIATPDPAFRALPLAARVRSGPLVVLDGWRIAEAQLAGREQVSYHALGRSTSDAENRRRLAALWAPGTGEPVPAGALQLDAG